MLVRKRLALGAVTALACAGLVGTAPASADNPKVAAETPAKVTVVASGLEGPRQLSVKDGYFYVAEADAGRVTRVRRSNGNKRVVATNLPDAQAVARVGGKLYMSTGEAEGNTVRPPGALGAKLYVGKPFHKRKTFADPYRFELKYNPDNQYQFDEKGVPFDAVSNPYFLIKQRGPGFMLLAAAGGNDVLAVSKKGRLKPFFVPSVVTTGICAKRPNNSGAGPSCDPTPTGIAYGPDGNLYISGLTGLAENEGRVYVVNRNGKLLRTLTGFSNSVSVAVGSDGSVYVSDLLQGAPPFEEAPAAKRAPLSQAVRKVAKAAAAEPAFDPSTIGQIVRVAPDGKRTYAQVPMPSGLLFTGGKLYANTWAIAGGPPLNIPHAGQIVSIAPSEFKAK